MAHLVVDSKHGRRSLIEVPPMQPIYQRGDLPAEAPRTYPPHYGHGNIYPSPRPDVRMYPHGHYYDGSFYGGPSSPVCKCCPACRERYNPSIGAPIGYYPYGVNQRPSFPSEEPYHKDNHEGAVNPRPVSEQLPLYHPHGRDLPPKPKSAHYFYGPDGELLPGPLEAPRYQEPAKKRFRPALDGDRESDISKPDYRAHDFLAEATLRYGRIKSVTVKHSSPSFKTLPEFLIDELENNYSGIPDTHVVLVAVNDNYSVYATPYAQGASYSHVRSGEQKPGSSSTPDRSFRQ